jgi:hypothetical protein
MTLTKSFYTVENFRLQCAAKGGSAAPSGDVVNRGFAA